MGGLWYQMTARSKAVDERSVTWHHLEYFWPTLYGKFSTLAFTSSVVALQTSLCYCAAPRSGGLRSTGSGVNPWASICRQEVYIFFIRLHNIWKPLRWLWNGAWREGPFHCAEWPGTRSTIRTQQVEKQDWDGLARRRKNVEGREILQPSLWNTKEIL